MGWTTIWWTSPGGWASATTAERRHQLLVRAQREPSRPVGDCRREHQRPLCRRPLLGRRRRRRQDADSEPKRRYAGAPRRQLGTVRRLARGKSQPAVVVRERVRWRPAVGQFGPVAARGWRAAQRRER